MSTMHQQTFDEIRPDDSPTKRTLREASEDWMNENQIAMDLFRRFASDMLQRRRSFGIGLLTERVRWEMAIGHDPGTIKINNNWRAYIARRLANEMPGLADLIECRVTKAADRPERSTIKDQRVDPITDEYLA